MLYTVRVRGIYATAISWLLHKKGFLLSDVSDVLRNRLPALPSERPPDVTVKSLDDLDHLLVIGYPWEAGEAVYDALAGELEYSTRRRGVYGLYTVLDGVAGEDCLVNVPGGVARLDSNPCPPPGQRVRVTIVREALEPGRVPRARPEVRVVGHYVIVTAPGRGLSYSEHIRGEDRKVELAAAIAGRLDLDSVHVHFRSASRQGDPQAAAAEAEELAREALRLAGEEPGDPRVVRRGEFIGILGVPLPSKQYLDGVRREVSPTIDWHHSLKSFGDEASRLVECAEHLLARGTPVRGLDIVGFLVRRGSGRRAFIEHVKPDGERLRLGPFRVATVTVEPRVEVVLERVFRSGGVLDGLGVEKKPGDKSVTRVVLGEWYLVHEYMTREGRLLGVYANVNTPVEAGEGVVKYFDLYVDVVKKPGERARVIDEDELERARQAGLVPGPLYEKALEVAEYLRRRLDSTYP